MIRHVIVDVQVANLLHKCMNIGTFGNSDHNIELLEHVPKDCSDFSDVVRILSS